MFKTIVFDLDGTLLDTIDDLSCALNGALSDCGYPNLSVPEIKEMVGDGTDSLMRRALERCSHQHKDEELLKGFYLPRYYANQTKLTQPFPQIIEMMDRLKTRNIKCFVYSNKPDFLTQEIVERFFGKRFAGVLGQKPGAKPKPNAEPLLEMLAAHHIDLATTVFIGDSNVDIYTGRNAGLKTVGVSWGFRSVTELASSGADFIVNSPNEIFDICIK